MPKEDHELEAQGAGEQQQQPEVERPEWLPEKFKAPEDMARSYSELERRLSEATQQGREQQERFDAYLAAQEQERQQAQTQQTGNDLSAAYAQAMEDGEYGRALEIQNYMTTQVMERTLGEFSQRFQGQMQPQVSAQTEIVAYQADQILTAQIGDDWSAYKARVAAEVQADPSLLPDQALQSPQATARALERVYKAIRHDDLTAQSAKDAEAAERLRREKLAAQTVEGTGGRDTIGSADETKTAWAAIKDADLGSYAGSIGS